MMDFLAALSGALIAVMLLMNGQLSVAWGSWAACVIIHIVGISVAFLWTILMREKPFIRSRMPKHLYLGGTVGVLTTLFGNMAAPAIGVSQTVALGLLGQMVAAAVIDGFGLLGARKIPFGRRTAVSLALICAGIAVMMLG